MRLLYTRVYGRYLRMKISRPTGRLKQNCTQCLTAVGCTRNSFQVLFRNRSIYSYVRTCDCVYYLNINSRNLTKESRS